MVGIVGIEYVLPEKIVTNDELVKEYRTWTAEKIFKKTGIEARHVSAESETAVDLGVRAAEKLIGSGIIEREQIDFVIFVSQSSDYILPTSACVIQERLGLKKHSGAFDINLGCSGYIYGLAVSKGLIEAGIASNVLLITSETYTKFVNPLDKSTRTIFGDGASATLVGKRGYKIGGFDLGTDGKGKELLIIPAGGARIPWSPKTCEEKNEDGNIRSQNNIYMDGTGIFDFVIREVPDSIERLLTKEKKQKQEVDMFIFHQANKYILDFLKRLIKIEDERFYINMADIGNTVSASVPIALKRALDDKSITDNHIVVLCGFGVGLSWGSTVIYT